MDVSVSEEKLEGVHVQVRPLRQTAVMFSPHVLRQMHRFGAALGELSPSDTLNRGQVNSFVRDVEASPLDEWKSPTF